MSNQHPDWLQPGQQVAIVEGTSATLRTVTRVTPTQVIIGARRYRRYAWTERYAEMGVEFGGSSLYPPDHPTVLSIRRRNQLAAKAREVRNLADKLGRGTEPELARKVAAAALELAEMAEGEVSA